METASSTRYYLSAGTCTESEMIGGLQRHQAGLRIAATAATIHHHHHQTSPAWGSWTMKPKLGGLTTATITVPTITGSSLGPWLHHGSPPPFGAC